jgi:hypothetical protein
MNGEKLVAIKYYYPEKDTIVNSVGWLEDAPLHHILVYEQIGRANLYSYIVIPKKYIKDIIKLDLKNK